MKKVGGYWLPAYDEHMSAEFAKGDGFQLDRLRAILRDHVPVDRRRMAVDGGAHVGSWTIELAAHFDHVLAFEPAPDTYAALLRNLFDRSVDPGCVDTYSTGLGRYYGVSGLGIDRKWPGNSGGVYLDPAGTGPAVSVGPLDAFALQELDFLKLDVEGAELDALRGAERTIRRCRPVIMVELKDRLLARRGTSSAETIAYLTELGAHEVARYKADVVFAFHAPKEGIAR